MALLALYPIRVPVMYQQSGESLIQIGGIAVTVPDSPAAMRELVRSDINRYVTVLLPLAVLGLREADVVLFIIHGCTERARGCSGVWAGTRNCAAVKP